MQANSRHIFVAFCIGLGLYIHLDLGVRVSVAEILLPIFLFLGKNELLTRYNLKALKATYSLLFLHFAAVVLGEFVNGSVEFSSLEFVKALARPFFILAFFAVATTINWDSRVLLSLLLGLTLSASIHWRFNSALDRVNFEADTIGYSFFVFRVQPILDFGSLLLICVLLRHNSMKWLAFIVAITATALSLRYGARSIFLVWSTISFLISTQLFFSRRTIERLLRSPVLSSSLAVVSLLILFQVYAISASQGWLGEMRQRKFLGQAGSNAESIADRVFSLLINSRLDSAAAFLKIIDSPVFGHGTLTYDFEYYSRAMSLAKMIQTRELTKNAMQAQSGGHAILLCTWASHGFLSVLFYFWCIYHFLSFIRSSSTSQEFGTCFVAYLVLVALWDLWFSPLSVQMRCFMPTVLCIIFYRNSCIEIFPRNIAPPDFPPNPKLIAR